MKKTILFFLLFFVQVSLYAQEYFPEGTKWTEIRLDTLKYDSWHSKVDGEWVPNFETIEYYVQGEFIDDSWGITKYTCVYTNGPEWSDSLTLMINEMETEYDSNIRVTTPFIFENFYVPACAYQMKWYVGKKLYSRDIIDSNNTGFPPDDYVFGTIEEIKEGDFGGVRPLEYVDLKGGRIIHGIGVTEWNDGECLFGPARLYYTTAILQGLPRDGRHYRSMLVHFERNGEVLYDVWPRKGSAVEVAIDGLNYFLNLKTHEAVITSGRYNCSGELDIPSEVSYNDETFTVKSMTYNAFLYNSELTKVRIPKTIENILHSYPYDSDDEDPPTGMVSPDHMNPFRGCSALESIEVDEENPSMKSVDGVLFSKDGTRLYCYPIGKQPEVYTIPDAVEWIGASAFEGSQNLTTLTIPSGVTYIGECAFADCNNFTDVYCYAENVPSTGSTVFGDTPTFFGYQLPIASATLHVPAGSIEEYKTTSPWSDFGNIVALPEEPRQPQSFLEGNPIWVYKHEHLPMGTVLEDDGLNAISCWLDAGNRNFTYYFLGGQKEIEGKVYTMMGAVGCNRDGEITLNHWLPVREENGIVYAFTDSLPGIIETEDNYDSRYNDEYNPMPYLQQGNECVLYNFSTNIGETLYPQNKGSTVKAFDTYQLLDGTECRVLKTNWGRYDLYEKLGFLSDDFDGIMDPFLSWPMPTNGSVFSSRLNAYYQDNTMLYKAPDAPDGLCVNDTCWTRDETEAYAVTYKANPYHEKVMSYIRQLQGIAEPIIFTEGQMATIVLPTEPEASKGKYYRLDRVDGREIIFEQELQPCAHVPYIIVPNEDFSIDLNTLDLEGCSPDTVSIKVRFEGQAESQSIYFIGSYVSEELEQQEGCNIQFIDTTPDCSISFSEETGKGAILVGALRAYLTWDDPIDHGGAKGRGDMEIVLRDYGTDIKTHSNSPLKGENKYDLSGRKIVNGKWHGIYIENGQKRAK